MTTINRDVRPVRSGLDKSFLWIPSLSLAAVIAGGASPAFSAVATFDFKTSPAINGSSLNFSAPSARGPIGVQVSAPAGGPYPAAGGINSAPSGLCAFMQNTPTDGTFRCNYDFTAPSATATNTSSLTGFQFTFDKTVRLKQFDVSTFAGLSSGSVSFAGPTPATFNVTGMGTQTFGSNYIIAANTPLTVTTAGLLSGTGSAVFRMDNLQVEEVTVPGPLPVLGAGVAFQFSRRLRKRMKQA